MAAARALSPESELAVAAGLYVGAPFPNPITAAGRLRRAVEALDCAPVDGLLGALRDAAARHLAGQAETPTALGDALRAYCAACSSARHREQPPMRRVLSGATHAHHSAPEDGL